MKLTGLGNSIKLNPINGQFLHFNGMEMEWRPTLKMENGNPYRQWWVGIAGPPGAGKSTLAAVRKRF